MTKVLQKSNGNFKNQNRLMRAVITSTAVEVGVVRARAIERAIMHPSPSVRALRRKLLKSSKTVSTMLKMGY